MIWTIVIGQAAISAVLCGVIAGSKNRDVAGWAILGFLLGLFALIAAVGVVPLPKVVPLGDAGPSDVKGGEPKPFDGERALSSDPYRLWLADRYSIQRNDIFNSFVVGDRMFQELEQALSYAHSQELEAIAGAEAAAIEKAETEERERQLREQRLAQELEQSAANWRKFWRKDAWIYLATVLVLGGGLFGLIRYQIGQIDQALDQALTDKQIARTATEESLKAFDLPLYEASFDHNPNAYADVWCKEWKDKNPKGVQFSVDSVPGNVEYFYKTEAVKSGYKEIKTNFGPEFHRSDGRSFKIATASDPKASHFVICFVTKG